MCVWFCCSTLSLFYFKCYIWVVFFPKHWCSSLYRCEFQKVVCLFFFCIFVASSSRLISTPEINGAAAAAGNRSKQRWGSCFTDRTNKLLNILMQRAGLRRCLFQTEIRRKSVGHFTWDFQLLKQDATQFYLQLQPVNKHMSSCNNLHIVMLEFVFVFAVFFLHAGKQNSQSSVTRCAGEIYSLVF